MFPGEYPVDPAVKTSFQKTVNGHDHKWQKEENTDPKNTGRKDAKNLGIIMAVKKLKNPCSETGPLHRVTIQI
jgi:hypothetical protein